MNKRYAGKDYVIQLDGKVIDADEVQEKLHSTLRGKLSGADILLVIVRPDHLSIQVGGHTLTLVPHDKSRPTVSYNLLLITTKNIGLHGIRFLQNGLPEESLTLDQ